MANISLSKTVGDQIFKVKSGRDKGKKMRLNTKNTSDKKIIRYTTSGMLQQLPPKHRRFCQFIFGSSGSGKSTYASKLLKEYKNIYPENPIYLISPKEKDPVLDKLNPYRIIINEKNFLSDDRLEDLNEISDSCILFDDVEGVTNKKIRDNIDALRNKILLVGRSYNISCITILHIAMNGYSTKIVLNESEFFTFFPNSGTNNAIVKTLQNYIGLSKAQVNEILNLNSRWVTIHKQYPMYVLYNQGWYLLK